MVTDHLSIDNESFIGDTGGYQDWLGECYAALVDAGYPKLAEGFFNCSGDDAVFFVNRKTHVNDDDAKSVYVCADEPEHGGKVCRYTCHLRFCPHCAKRASARLLRRYVPAVQDVLLSGRRGRLRKLVLTTDIDLRAGNAAAEFNRLSSCIQLFFDEVLDEDWRQHQGVICAAEFGPRGKKLHFHVLHFGQWISNKPEDGYPMATAWSKVTGIPGAIARVYGVSSEKVLHEVVEVLKYTTKFWSKDSNGKIVRLEPDLVPKLHEVLLGQRRIRSYGLFYRIPDEVSPPVCSTCGSHQDRWCVGAWNIFVETGWTPDEQRDNLGSDIGNNFLEDARLRIKEEPPPPSQMALASINPR